MLFLLKIQFFKQIIIFERLINFVNSKIPFWRKWNVYKRKIDACEKENQIVFNIQFQKKKLQYQSFHEKSNYLNKI